MEQESSRKSLHHSQSPEVASKASTTDTEVNDSYKCLTEKLSAALVNVGAKEDLVKQHAKVAEEAVAGIFTKKLLMNPRKVIIFILYFLWLLALLY